MRRRQGAAALAAAALCFGGALTACGSGGGDGYVAVGAAGSGPEEAPTAAVPPKGKVVLVPLDGAAPPDGPAGRPSGSGTTAPGGELPAVPGGGGTSGGTGSTAGGTGGSGGGSEGSDGSGTTGGSGGTPATPTTPGTGTTPTTPPAQTPGQPPAGPALLTLTEPIRSALEQRWCEKVTVEFRNTGGSPVTSGTVTFATHIIGLLGIDWATVESAQPLPAPIPAGSAKKQAYTVCVDAWRVPLGMHIETQDVSAVWK
ncbi:hypothetical protein [Streptomyces sp. NPDC020681]|uniref:hypothetical protein n=1 Tax=Streptomyces sp. NPDC020681 TaxID=3365083 RepID=UPI00379E69FB